MRRIHFYVNQQKPQASEKRRLLAERAATLGLQECEGKTAEAIVVLGGDGTILQAVHEFPGIPVLGLNLGGLGYLASVEERDFERALTLLVNDGYKVSQRSMLEVRKADKVYAALNDVVVSREMSGHATVLDLRVDGKSATRYFADGLIIATPTGSTAYSLAAGGPVLMPDVSSIVITPMSPHALGIRPMVVKDTAKLTVTSCKRPNGDIEQVGVYVDGIKVFGLDNEETVEIATSPLSVSMLVLPEYNPYEILARKLGWSGAGIQYGMYKA